MRPCYLDPIHPPGRNDSRRVVMRLFGDKVDTGFKETRIQQTYTLPNDEITE